MKNSKCNKLNPNCPPDVSGEFNINTKVYGNLNGVVIPLDKPLESSYKGKIKQNNIFVESTFIYPSGIPEREPQPGVWKKKYDQNLNFAGWELYIVDTTNDNGHRILSPVCIKNNKVMKFSGIYVESGFMKGNELQTPLVTSFSGVRLC